MKVLSQQSQLSGTQSTIDNATVVRLYNETAESKQCHLHDSNGVGIGTITIPATKVEYIQKKPDEYLTGSIGLKCSKIAYSPMMAYASWTGGGGGAAASVEFDLTTGSLPAGMYQQSPMSTPTLTWDSTGAKFTGDSGNPGPSYPLRIATGFTGDYLFQLSTRIDQNPTGGNWCSDASLAVFNTTYDGSTWTWKWDTGIAGRISAQNNCKRPYIYGETIKTEMTDPSSGNVLDPPAVSDGDWVTMHLYHEPSLSRTRYEITVGSKDWGATGTRIGTAPNSGILELADSFSGTYWVGVSGDDDDDSMYANGLRYSQL